MEMKITVNEGMATIESPYNPEFVGRIKKMGGKWDASRKVWTVDARNVEMVRAAMREIYGMDDQPADMVSVRVITTKVINEYRAPISMFGRVVASAFGRDSGARLGDGVVVVKGEPTSTGSMKNWYTTIPSGCELILHDIPRAAVENEIGVYEGMEYEILEAEKPNLENLRAEKERLLARIAEIDAILNA